jgi:antitoxin ParD1/3/4
MQVEIDERLEAVIRRKVAIGGYRDAAEVIQEAIDLMEERDRRLERLRAEIAIGVAQIERGELIEFTPELLERLSREAEENARLEKPIKDAVKP